jgi:hypothetical protein
MDVDDRLRLDYECTTAQISALTDVRFKLLALVPTIATAAVAFAGDHPSTGVLISVGLLGLLATTGILLYELGNTATLDAALYRADDLERRLGLDVNGGQTDRGAATRSTRQHRLFGTVTVGQDQALGLVYGAALGGWGYLLAWGALHAAHVGNARLIGGAIGACCAVAVLLEVWRVSAESRNEAGRLAADQVPPQASSVT